MSKDSESDVEVEEKEAGGKRFYAHITSHISSVKSKVGRGSKLERNLPYPSGFNLKKFKIELTVNNNWLRSKLHFLRENSRPIRATILSVSILTLYLGVEDLKAIPLVLSAILFLVAGLKFRVVALAKPATVNVSTPSPKVQNKNKE